MPADATSADQAFHPVKAAVKRQYFPAGEADD
jgi:hypothetical protein